MLAVSSLIFKMEAGFLVGQSIINTKEAHS
jgi:hypothetical protein